MKAYPVTVLCKVMEVSRSGFYNYLKHLNSPDRDRAYEARLRASMQKIFEKSWRTYGSRRMLRDLKAQGYRIGRFKVRRLMRELKLIARCPRRFKVTTDSGHCYPIADNILNRKFNVDKPNRVWAADISYVWTLEGWQYLAIVMDLFSRRIVGWAMDKHINKELTLNALTMAYWRRKPAEGLLHHSDRGAQYACIEYQKRLRAYKMEVSMSRKGNCWDNAPVERFFRSLKSERLNWCRFATRKAAQLEVLDYITFYNSVRLHSVLGYQSPMAYEKEQLLKAA